MGDYNLTASHPTMMSGYGPGVTGATFPRKAMSSLTASSSGTGISWDSVNIRANISNIVGTMYVHVTGNCTVIASTTNANVGLAVYKNNLQISTGTCTNYLGGITPFSLHIQWAGSVVSTDYIELFLIAASTGTTLSTVSDVVLTVRQIGGSSLRTTTSLNSTNPQWALRENTTADNATTLSTIEVSALTYITGSTTSSVDAITNTPPFTLNKLGVYHIFANICIKNLTATSMTITIRLKIAGVTLITRQFQTPTAIGYSGGSIDYLHTLTSGTATVDVTVVSSAVNGYVIASGSTVCIKLIRRNVV